MLYVDIWSFLQDLWSPLYWAAKLNYIDIAKILVDHGACLNVVNAVCIGLEIIQKEREYSVVMEINCVDAIFLAFTVLGHS